MTSNTRVRSLVLAVLVATLAISGGLLAPAEASTTYSCVWLDSCDSVCTSPFVVIDPIGPCSDGYGNFASAQCPNGDLFLCRQTS